MTCRLIIVVHTFDYCLEIGDGECAHGPAIMPKANGVRFFFFFFLFSAVNFAFFSCKSLLVCMCGFRGTTRVSSDCSCWLCFCVAVLRCCCAARL